MTKLTAKEKRWQDDTPMAKQIKVLNKNGIYPLESRVKAKMIVVKREDLERATELKKFDEITIASRF